MIEVLISIIGIFGSFLGVDDRTLSVPYPGNEHAIECSERFDRFLWAPYAIDAGFPPEVLPELRYVIQRESGGDLCAVNPSSNATCWIQQVPGGPEYYNPRTCMAIGYAKWLDGGRSFERHWYRFW